MFRLKYACTQYIYYLVHVYQGVPITCAKKYRQQQMILLDFVN